LFPAARKASPTAYHAEFGVVVVSFCGGGNKFRLPIPFIKLFIAQEYSKSRTKSKGKKEPFSSKFYLFVCFRIVMINTISGTKINYHEKTAQITLFFIGVNMP
jgi:hypothetical protein